MLIFACFDFDRVIYCNLCSFHLLIVSDATGRLHKFGCIAPGAMDLISTSEEYSLNLVTCSKKMQSQSFDLISRVLWGVSEKGTRGKIAFL